MTSQGMPRRLKFVQNSFYYQIELLLYVLLFHFTKKIIPNDPELHRKTTFFNCSPNSNLGSHGVVVAFLHTGQSQFAISQINCNNTNDLAFHADIYFIW